MARSPPQQDETADGPGGDDRPRSEQVHLDVVSECDTDCCGRDERDDQSSEELPPGVVTPDDAVRELGDAVPVQRHDGEDRAALDGDRIGVGGRLAGSCPESEESLGDEEVPGG